jgi:hypothetical protein
MNADKRGSANGAWCRAGVRHFSRLGGLIRGLAGFKVLKVVMFWSFRWPP